MSMEKSVDYMVHEFSSGAHRQGVACTGGECGCGSLRLGDEAETARAHHHPGAAFARRPAFRCGHGEGYREGAQGIEDRDHAAGDGKIIRLPIPEFSEERRKDLVQSLGKMAEEARVRVRGNRRTALDEAKKLKAAGGLSEDGLRDLEGEVQKLTDRFVKSIDDHLKRKEAEVMKIMNLQLPLSTLHDGVSAERTRPTKSLQPHQIQQKLAPKINHPAPGIFYLACRSRLKHALVDVVRDLVAQIVFHFHLDSLFIHAHRSCPHSPRFGAETRDGFGKAARMIDPAAGD